jgi:hypothetical protein
VIVTAAHQAILARLRVQARLTVGAAHDRYEQEADRIAAQVMQTPATATTDAIPVQRLAETEDEAIQPRLLAAAITPWVQRQAEETDDDDTVQAKAVAPGAQAFDPGPAFSRELQRQQPGGQPLPQDVRGFMEQRFGADFGRVRVHTDGGAAQLNRAILAQAFTHGRDIYFGQGHYRPHTPGGQQLLAHELTHTIQQGASVAQRTASMAAQGAPAVQAKFVHARVTATAQLHTVTVDPKKGQPVDRGVLEDGRKLKANDVIRVEDDPVTHRGEWTPAIDQAHQGYIRAGKYELTPLPEGVEEALQQQPQPADHAPWRGAYILDATTMHSIVTRGNAIVDAGALRGGRAFKTGDSIEVYPEKTLGDWVVARDGQHVGYVHKSKLFLVNRLAQKDAGQIITDATRGGDEESGLDEAKEITEGVSEQAETYTSSTTTLAEHFGDSPLGEAMGKTSTGLELTQGIFGTTAQLLGLIASAKTLINFKNNDKWKNLEAGYGFIAAGAKGVESAIGGIETANKLTGGKFSFIDEAGPVKLIAGAIASGLSALKGAALAVINLYKIFKAKSSEKTKDAMVIFKDLSDAAASAAKTAQGVFQFVTKTVPAGLLSTLPFFGIVTTTCDLLIRLYDALTARGGESKMIAKSDPLRAELAQSVEEAPPTEASVDASRLFVADRRGVFPNYKTYFRVKAAIRDALNELALDVNKRAKELTDKRNDARQKRALAKAKRDEFTQKAVGQPTARRRLLERATVEPLEHEATKAEQAYIKAYTPLQQRAGVEALKPIVQRPKTALGAAIGLVTTTQILKLSDLLNLDPATQFTPLEQQNQKVQEYEFSDKMSEINQKRQTAGWTDVALDLVNMAADIVNLVVGATGIGALIGMGMKTATAAYKGVHASSKWIQKTYRNLKQTDRSTANKHIEYVRHARFIFEQWAKLPEPPPARQVQELETMTRATGVNYGLWLALDNDSDENQQKRVEMLVEAMKKR